MDQNGGHFSGPDLSRRPDNRLNLFAGNALCVDWPIGIRINDEEKPIGRLDNAIVLRNRKRELRRQIAAFDLRVDAGPVFGSAGDFRRRGGVRAGWFGIGGNNFLVPVEPLVPLGRRGS